MKRFTSIEICAGAGGQAKGIEDALFDHVALVDNDRHSCETLKLNRPKWNVTCGDIGNFDGTRFDGVDLLAGGLPCPPFSVAGKQLGENDERNLFPDAIRLIDEISPRAIMIENVKGILDQRFDGFREDIANILHELGFVSKWYLVNASDFGVPQLRPRAIMVGLKAAVWPFFDAPMGSKKAPTVGETLKEMMAAAGWPGAEAWAGKANKIAPTIVGGSKKHGGPDLGPTRARKAWLELGVNGKTVAQEPPDADFPVDSVPRLTVQMVARLQGFPNDWKFSGKKTAAYRQVGNAFPPPVARAFASQVRDALVAADAEVEVKIAS